MGASRPHEANAVIEAAGRPPQRFEEGHDLGCPKGSMRFFNAPTALPSNRDDRKAITILADAVED
jgi:hypothetical protein